jgi:SNF2 family DNA or RNA helicase
MARAVCELESTSRWAVTGTPIQNRLGDLASLLKFIRAYPYTDPKHFDADVSRPWKSGEDEEAVKRLKRLSACLLLRRPKGAIDLPPRRDLICPVDFTQEERTIYEQIRHQTITNIDEALGNDTGPSNSRVYVNVLQQIESLRLFSNLGLHYLSRHKKPSQQSSELEQWKMNAQQTFNSQREMMSMACMQCSSVLGLTDTLFDESAHATESAQFTSCLQFICSECASKTSISGQALSCGHLPSCPVVSVSTSGIALEEVESFVAPKVRPASMTLPSKIKALLEDLKRVPDDIKWYLPIYPLFGIVFWEFALFN